MQWDLPLIGRMNRFGDEVSFIQFLIEHKTTGYNVYNYVDKPDLTMNALVAHVGKKGWPARWSLSLRPGAFAPGFIYVVV